MNSRELEKKLHELGVRPDSYVLDGSLPDEQYALERDGTEWTVSYYERGQRDVFRRFPTEGEACEYLVNVLLEDNTTRPRPLK
jgi:hypothetical protein